MGLGILWAIAIFCLEVIRIRRKIAQAPKERDFQDLNILERVLKGRKISSGIDTPKSKFAFGETLESRMLRARGATASRPKLNPRSLLEFQPQAQFHILLNACLSLIDPIKSNRNLTAWKNSSQTTVDHIAEATHNLGTDGLTGPNS